MSRRRMKKLAEKAKYFWQDESAVGVVEVILILVDIFTWHTSQEKGSV